MLIENINVRKDVFLEVTTHQITFRKDLPDDKDLLLRQITIAKENSGMLKDEWLRML